ncbi:TPA: hypothetical protein G8577_004783 [Salmonella enterica]|uniref:Lipoprotein n=1 Tax=Salmonella enterica TaxID=28901 RepID=A0A764Z2D9_SALER|nr:hypothetical protein [Salmonella enterica]
MKKLIPAIIATALLSGCATQNDAVELSNRISDQQKQINALSVRLQSAEYRLSKQESAFRAEQTQNGSYCYLNGVKYSQGTMYAGRICDASSGSAAWRVYTHR